MKRSEMLENLKNRLQNIMGSGESGPLYPNDDYLVHCMLDEVEKSGMLPPFNKDEYYRVWREDGSGYKWEKEDSKSLEDSLLERLANHPSTKALLLEEQRKIDKERENDCE